MRRNQAGIAAASVAIAIAGAFAAVGVAGADQQAANATITADDGQLFTPNAVTIAAGESVTWTFDNPTQYHNVAADPDSPTAWSFRSGDPSTNHPDATFTFAAGGTYTFHCEVHPGMQGTVTVTGGGTPTPTPTTTETPTPTPTTTPTPTPTASATPTPTPVTPIPQPGGGGVATTPAPHASADRTRPTLRRLKLKAVRHGARVKFTLSENATVSISVKRGKKVVKSARVQVRRGTHTVKLRKLKKGRYTVRLRARDAAGNRSAMATKRLRVRR